MRTEIIIFIRPRLIRHKVDARAVTEEFRDKLTTMKQREFCVSGADVKR
jgi:type II secretory pathway component GspD/PulD (secretin)